MTPSPSLIKAKQLFMTYRNGIVADSLRNAGMPYKFIFGLQLPQLSNIASGFKSELTPEMLPELAWELWADRNVRESRLLACWIFNPNTLTITEAVELTEDLQTREEADVICFRLLRNLPYAGELANRISGYCRTALMRNLD